MRRSKFTNLPDNATIRALNRKVEGNRANQRRYKANLLRPLENETLDRSELDYRILHFVWAQPHERTPYWTCINFLAAQKGSAARIKVPERCRLMECIRLLRREGKLAAGWRKGAHAGMRDLVLTEAGEKAFRQLSGTSAKSAYQPAIPPQYAPIIGSAFW